MTPTYEELLQGTTTWRFQHKGVSYSLSHHGYREGKQYDDWYSEPHCGTWCYYIHVTEQMYPNSWEDFKNVETEYGLTTGPAWDHVDFYGGITWNSDEDFRDYKTKRIISCVKVGCDYNHSWDRDAGYWQGLEDVKRDAIKTIDGLLTRYPLERVRCGYSGHWVRPEEAYTAINGQTVAKVTELPEGYDSWKEDK